VAAALFDKQFLNTLEKLILTTRRRLPGRYSGHRRALRRGDSVEFADFKAYAAGDDFRHIDWNAYARMEKLFLKLFLEEQDTCIHLLVDCSRSMAWKDGSKLRLAKQLAAALGYLSLANFDRVAVTGFGSSNYSLGPLRGKGSARRLFDFIESLPEQENGDLASCLGQLAPAFSKPGVAVVVSDLFLPALDQALARLCYYRQETTVVQVLHPLEANPQFQGELQLVDCENHSVREITFNKAVQNQYRRKLSQWQSDIKGLCNKYAINYVGTTSDKSLEQLVLRQLRRVGLLG